MPHENLPRHEQSRVHSAKVRANGKLFCKSLKTKSASMPRLRLGDLAPGAPKRTPGARSAPEGKMSPEDTGSMWPGGTRAGDSRRWRCAALLKPGSADPPTRPRGKPCPYLRSAGQRCAPVPELRHRMPLHPAEGPRSFRSPRCRAICAAAWAVPRNLPSEGGAGVRRRVPHGWRFGPAAHRELPTVVVAGEPVATSVGLPPSSGF